MKVVYLLDSLNRGGSEVLALDVCRNAKENDLDLIFIATGEGNLENEIRNSRVEFIKLKRRFPFDLQLVLSIRKILIKNKIDIIHVHQCVEGLHAYFATFGTKTKVIFSHHGYIPDKKNLYALWFLLPRVNQNIVCSQSLLEWYRKDIKLVFPKNTRVIYNGVDSKRIVSSDENIKAELNIPQNSTIFGMIGNFYHAPRKDQLTICKALPKVFSEVSNSYFIFVGKTEIGAENNLAECKRICEENNISNRVFFLGIRSDIPRILNSLDVFVLSSLHEGLPIAILEAMLSGTPCLLSDIKPLIEISESGKYAEIFETQNAEDFTNKLIKLAKNKNLRLELADQAKFFANDTFSIKTHLNNLKIVYQEII